MKETVKKFTKLIIENCHKFKIARQFHGHKYKQVELPESIEDAEKKILDTTPLFMLQRISC